jgi:hypothetical protein
MPGHDEIGRDEPAAATDQTTDQGDSDPEGRVGDDPERASRQS